MRLTARSRSVLALALLSALAGGVPLFGQEEQSPETERAEVEVDTVAVQVDGRTLFRVRGVSSYDAATRARAIAERIETVAADPSVSVDALSIIQDEGPVRIVAGNRPIMAVTAADARLEQVMPSTLAAVHLDRIKGSISDYRSDRSSAALRGAALRTGVAFVVALVAAALLLLATRRVNRLADSHLNPRLHSVGIQSFEIVRADRIRSAIANLVRAGTVVLFLVVVFGFLSYALRQFPWTRGTSLGLVAMLIGPLQTMGRAVIQHIPNLIFLAVLFVVVRFTLRITRLFFDAVGRGFVTLSNFDPEWAAPTYKMVRFALIAFAIVVAYPYIPGSQSDAFKGVSLFVGLVFSLGSSATIANLIAGYLMTYRRAFKIGDRVKIGDFVGDVTEMGLQVTRLRTPKNEEITIPNSQVLNGEVLNYNTLVRTRDGLILHTEVGIGYETPWRQVEAMLIMAAERTPGILLSPPPFVLQKRLGDFAITYELNVYADNPQAMGSLYTAIHRSVLDVFNEYGVQIMTPAYEGDPASPKVVAPDHWEVAPAVVSHPQSTTAAYDPRPFVVRDDRS